MDLSPYKGIAQFGPDYENTLRNEPHATGSVDKVLAESMVRLCAETAEHLYGDHTSLCRRYVRGTRPQLERYLKEAPVDSESGEVIVEAICRFCSALQSRAPDEIHDLEFGGTEEEIVTRGSDWCTDVARIGCVLAQIAGLPARTVGLFDLHRAHSGHDIIEVYRDGAWGAADPLNDVVYRHPNGRPTTTWELMADPALVEAHSRPETAYYTTPSQFSGVAISNYYVWDHDKYDYSVTTVNSYTRRILQMSEAGWPGGLRWLHGEDR